jgi:hypothetical protein
MKKPAKRNIPLTDSAGLNAAFAEVAQAFAHDASVTRKRMFGSANTVCVNGKLFAMLARSRFVAKLPKARVDGLVEEGVGERFTAGQNRQMREWISVAEGDADWDALAQEAYNYVKKENEIGRT